MVKLYYPPSSQKINTWQDRLARMAMRHELIQRDELPQPYLRYGEEIVQGTDAIDTYLDELEELVKTWYECRCDKYEF